MALEVDGKTIETTETGFLVELDDWSETVARAMARHEGLELTPGHWDVIRYLRHEYYGNDGHQPNTRTMVKAMQEQWGGQVTAQSLYQLFPGDPSKQAGRIAGLPESRRKGGY